MKKIAITFSMATLLMGGIIGCGDTDNQGAGGLGNGDQRGFGYHTTDRGNNNITDDRAGEGPITDMFTRDDRNDRRGARSLGRDGRHPATGLAGERGMGRYGNRTGEYGGKVMNGAGMRGQGAGYGAAGHPGTGTNRGANYGTREKIDSAAGIVGDRPGYVDDRGILRRRNTTARHGLGGLGQTGRTNMKQDGRNGMIGQFNRQGANGRASDRIMQGKGMREFAYPTDYDTQTVNRLNTRLADVENVRDSRVIVHGNRVVIGVDANGDTQRIEQDVRKTVTDMVGDREVIVVTERDQFNQIRTADDRLRAGEPFEEVGATIEDMLEDFGRAMQRPFERSR